MKRKMMAVVMMMAMTAGMVSGCGSSDAAQTGNTADGAVYKV